MGVATEIQSVLWACMQDVFRGAPTTTVYDHLSTASHSSGAS